MKKILTFSVFAFFILAVILFIAAGISFVISFFIASATSISTGCFDWAVICGAYSFICEVALSWQDMEQK